MENPAVSVRINARWIRGVLERHLGRQISANGIAEITRETIFVLENALASGGRVSVGSAIAEALDVLGFMTDTAAVAVTGIL